MRYTYKRETFWGDKKNNKTIIAGIVVLVLSLMLARDAKQVAVMMGGIGIFVLLVGVADAVGRKRKNSKHRREMMTKGYLSKGEIVDAGGKLYKRTEYSGHRDENNRRESYRFWESNWWIEVQYYDEGAGIYKRFRAQNMNKNGKLHRMIGKEVEVYKYDDFVYINVPD